MKNEIDSIKDTLRSIKSLSDNPGAIDGEKQAARQALERLMKKHKLTENDLFDEATTDYAITAKDEFEFRLIIQVVYFVTNDPSLGFYRAGRNKLTVQLTKVQYADIKTRFEVYRSALNKELNRMFEAFVQKNNIFGDGKRSKEKQYTPEKIAEMRRILLLADSVDRINILKQLEA